MFGTKALGSLKGMLPSIHYPLPLTRKESQKLLDVLKSSFREDLEQEHGSPQDGARQPRQRHRRPTDRHLDAILSNPLFSYNKEKCTSVAASLRDPMDTFDAAVAKGMMTLAAAEGCLKAKRQQIIGSGAISVRDAMAASGAGIRVVRWLRASGHERRLSFFASRGLIGELVPFMEAEGLSELAWSWLERMAADPTLEKGQIAGSELLYHLVAVHDQSSPGENLDPAIATVLRALDVARQTKLLPWTAQAWRKTALMHTLGGWRRSPPSTPLYDTFLGTSEMLPGSPYMAVDLPHLHLHHPTDPDASQAMAFFRNKSLWSKFTTPVRPSGSLHVTRRKSHVAEMGMDAVKYLTGIGRKDDAQWILKLLETHFLRDLKQPLLLPIADVGVLR